MLVPFADPLPGLRQQNAILPLIGREMEMQMVSRLLDTVEQESAVGARALILSGEIGMGKSRLLAEMYQEARARGFLILETHIYESGNIFPYLPFIEVLRPIIRSSSPQQLRIYTGLSTSGAEPADGNISLTGLPLVTALSQLFPELPARLGFAHLEQEHLSPDQTKFRLFDSIATFLEQIALQQPVLLSIDNLQWADSASLELTMYLTVRLHNSRVALAGATRPATSLRDGSETVGAPNAIKVLGQLMRQGLLLFLPLGPLGEAAVLQHLSTLLPGTLSAEIAQSLIQRTDGNLYFLEELVRSLVLREQLVLQNNVWQARNTLSAVRLPESITWAVEEYLQELRCRELLQVATLFGRVFPSGPLIEVFGHDADETHALLSEALGQNIIAQVTPEEVAKEDDAGDFPALSNSTPVFVFCRGIVHETLRAGISSQQAISLHGSIGEALEKHYRATGQTRAADLANHYLLGGRKSEALYWSIQAGEEATHQQSHREVISHLRVAIRLLEAGIQPSVGREDWTSVIRMYIALGESWFKLGELAQAASAFRQALEKHQEVQEADGEQDLLLLARANRLLADVYRMESKYELAMAHLQVASNLLADEETDESTDGTRMQPFWLLSGRGYDHSLHLANRNAGPQHSQLTLSATERLLLMHTRATLAILLYQPEKAEKELWLAYHLATEIGDRSSQGFALHFLGWLRGWGEHIAEATRLILQARELYLTSGDPFHTVLEDQSLGSIFLARGEMEQARFYNLHGFEQARRYGVQQIIGWLHCNQAIQALMQGDWEESELHLRNALQDAMEGNNLRLQAFATQAQALLYFRRGNWAEAEQSFQEALRAAINTEWYPSTLALYGHFLAVTGRESAALAQLEQVKAQPEPSGYSAQFYIPFLAEAHLHLQKPEDAVMYTANLRNLRGLCYYGLSVDRVLGELAVQQGDWEGAEQAFADGLALCRRSRNQPEEATILYEQARTVLMRSRSEPPEYASSAIARIHALCSQARALFLAYGMQRAISLVDTLQEGVDLLEEYTQPEKASRPITPEHLAHAGYQLDLRLTRRELEVLRLVAEGHTDREVADALVLSPRTVNRHLSNIFTRLDVPGRAAAVALAIRLGLVK